MSFPNLLASKTGRLFAFFCLYVTEGIPLGFTATTLATQMRREGLGPEEIGTFVATLYLPWAWKWALGPVVDTVHSRRLGRRRAWIVGAQLLMVLTLLGSASVDFTENLAWFTTIILVHNLFGATQDVAIDALAVQTLPAEERGLANGLMFGGAYLGQAIGGAGMLFLLPTLGLNGAFVLVSATILTVTLFVALPLQEAAPAEPERPLGLSALREELVGFVKSSFRAMFGTRHAFSAFFVALLPAGACALSLSLSSNLAVELGMSDAAIGELSLYSAVIAAGACVLGGFLSDRIGRRRGLALWLAGTGLPTLWLAWQMSEYGWITPIPLDLPDRPVVPAGLVDALWTASLAFAFFNGLMYGTRSALFMDVTNPAVAATQFTAYMALLNVTISYSALWQGHAVVRWGYPRTLVIDAVLGVLAVALLPLTVPRQSAPTKP